MYLQKTIISLIILLTGLSLAGNKPLCNLSIDDCVKLTLKNNPQMRSIEGLLQSGNGNYISNRAGLFPSVNLQAQAGESNGSVNSPTALATPAPSYIANLQIQQLLYDFGKTPSKVSSARNLYNSALFDSATVVRNLILSTVVAYINLIESRSVVEINKETLKQTEDHLRNAQILYDAGRGVKYNVVKAEVDKANADLNLIKSKNTERLNLLQLQNLVGDILDSAVVLSDTVFTKDSLPSADSAFSVAFKNRSDLQSLKMKFLSAQSKTTAARRGRFPSLSISGGYGYKIADIPVDNLHPAWSIGALMGVPLFSGGAQKGAIEQAIGEQKNAEAALNTAQQSITLEIQQQISSCIEAAQRLDISTKAIDQAQLALSLAQERFNVGTGSAVEVADAEIQYENAKIAGIQARCDYRIARARLSNAMGVITFTDNQMEIQK
jgi:outer membrane protein